MRPDILKLPNGNIYEHVVLILPSAKIVPRSRIVTTLLLVPGWKRRLDSVHKGIAIEFLDFKA